MSYVDGYVMAVKTEARGSYTALAAAIGRIYMDHGALAVWECWGDDIPRGTHTSFVSAVHLRDDETPVFGWCVWPSRDARDAGLATAAKDPRFAELHAPDVVDGQRMIWGGFTPLVALTPEGDLA